jgi:type IV secretory pathway VirB2 component (pilin)
MFWGWLKSFVQYAFYPLVANAYTLIFGQVIIAFCTRQLADGTSLSQVFFPLLVVFVVYIYGIFKLPSLVNSMFSGRSGESAGPGLR